MSYLKDIDNLNY